MMNRNMKAMSPAETEVLRLVWQLGEATVQQVCAALPARRKVAYKTVQTLLHRLEEKGYLRHTIKGKAHIFLPAVQRDQVVKRTVLDFLDRLFGGDPRPLMQFLAEDGRIDAEDIEKLKELIEKPS
jgi:BlaI family transcriptional regulator, penicillinase repressor